jgi:hypothetical protein
MIHVEEMVAVELEGKPPLTGGATRIRDALMLEISICGQLQ